MNNAAPVILFVYNRLDHLKQVVDGLLVSTLSKNTDIIIYSDGPGTQTSREGVDKVRDFIKNIEGFRSVKVIESKINKGLADSIIEGVTETLKSFDSVIVLEDDLYPDKYFLEYMNEALELYKEDENVASIHGYNYPVKMDKQCFFLKGADCWGWGTWKRAWEHFEKDGSKLLDQLKSRNLVYEFDFFGNYPYTQMLEDQIKGQNDSWAVRWKASAFLNDMYTLYPGKSLIRNLGADKSGTHTRKTKQYEVELENTYTSLKKIPVEEKKEDRIVFANFYRSIRPGFLDKLKYGVKRVVGK